MKKIYFQPSFFKFLRDLKRNNNRPWFQANKGRYELEVRNPLLDFIGEIGPHLRKISKHIVADNSPQRRFHVPHLPGYPFREGQNPI